MSDRYLLYVDVLGFTDLTFSHPKRVEDLFEVVASLNLFRHEGFAAIAFSDTLLVHNVDDPTNDYGNRHAVMFLCEFFKDLLHRTAGRRVFFRAVLTFGEFEHYRLNDIPFFYGPALIRAYTREKQLPVTGLLMDESCRVHSDIFSTLPFDDEWHYTFVTQALDQYEDLWGAMIPLPEDILGDTDLAWFLGPELELLAGCVAEARSNPDDRVKAKHIATLQQYRKRYPRIFGALEPLDFRMEAVNPGFDWAPVRERLSEDYSWGSRRDAPRRGGRRG